MTPMPNEHPDMWHYSSFCVNENQTQVENTEKN